MIRFTRQMRPAAADFERWLRRQTGSRPCKGVPASFAGIRHTILGQRHDDTCCYLNAGGPDLTPPRGVSHDEALQQWADQADATLLSSTANTALVEQRQSSSWERDGSRVFNPARTSRYRANRKAWLDLARKADVEVTA